MDVLSLIVAIAAVLIAIILPPRLAAKASKDAYELASKGWLAAHESGLAQQLVAMRLQVRDRARAELVADLNAYVTWTLSCLSFATQLNERWDAIDSPTEKDAWLPKFMLENAQELNEEYSRVKRLSVRIRDYRYVFPFQLSLIDTVEQITDRVERSWRQLSLGVIPSLTHGGTLDASRRLTPTDLTYLDAAAIALSELRHHINVSVYSALEPDNPTIRGDSAVWKIRGIVETKDGWEMLPFAEYAELADWLAKEDARTPWDDEEDEPVPV